MLHHRKKPDIETSGFAARFYDQLLIIFTLGLYHNLLKRVIRAMDIQPSDHILDMGAGTGKNALHMRRYIGEGSITALEIGEEMNRQFARKCRNADNVYLEKLRIDATLPYRNQFDRVLISFVLHGFEEPGRALILHNAFQSLKPGGKLHIFDWNRFSLQDSGPFMKFFMTHIECGPARDFIERDLHVLLLHTGFHDIADNLYFKNQIRLLTCAK
jgi:demethylmenaquinone methyltransferase/2-methoxy-6-polyprenyl-1,4-benzoquinol methylase